MLAECYSTTGNAMISYVCELRDIFDTVIAIDKNNILDFDAAKDIIAQKLVTI